MLDNSMLPVVSWWGIYEQLHLLQDGEYHVLRFRFVRGWAAILPIGGLGVEDQQNGLIVMYFVGLGQRGSLRI
jgi:hypothetical protein